MYKFFMSTILLSSALLVADASTPIRPYLPYRSQSENAARLLVGMNDFYHRVAVTSSMNDHKPVMVESVQKKDEPVVSQPVVKKHVAKKNVETKKTIKKLEHKQPESFWNKSVAYVKGIFSKEEPKSSVQTDMPLYTKNAAVETQGIIQQQLGHYGVFSVIPEYTRSFNSDNIAQSLFGWSLQDGCSLKITGSDVANRNEKDLLADWLYLSQTYEGSISFKPVIQNALVDMNLYWGMDAWLEGLYFRMHAPLTWTKYDLGASFKTTDEGQVIEDHLYGPFFPPQGYRNTLLDSSEKFFCKKEFITTGEAPGLIYPPDYTAAIYHPLTAARFCGCFCDDAKTLVRLADIQADLGWDFLRRDRGYMGVYLRGVAPTGNRPHGRWLFEPIIGNGHHWELGGGLVAGATLWRNTAQTKSINFTFDAHATHLFNALQHRVFDLKDMPLSRYMTAYRSNNPEFTPVANLTATTINSSFAAQGEITTLLNATIKNWSFEVGYDFWAQTCEKIECSSWSNNCYAKSIARDGLDIDTDINSKWAVNFESTVHAYGNPVGCDLLENSDLDYEGARSKGMSHKVFGHVGYAWMDREVIPFVGIGAEGEFGRNTKCSTKTCTNNPTTCSSNDCCTFVSLSQWGVWIKGGVSF